MRIEKEQIESVVKTLRKWGYDITDDDWMDLEAEYDQGEAEVTVSQARVDLIGKIDDGAKCPVCDQFAKVYRRKLHSQMARDLLAVARAGRMEERAWVEVGEVVGRTSPDLVKLRYWRLLEARPGIRDDGSSRVGWWRLTERGLAFVRGELRVPSHARVYNGELLTLTGPLIGIRDALGKKFRYDELMAA